MRTQPNNLIDPYRLADPASDDGANWGAFLMFLNNNRLHIISSGSFDNTDWEHVSVSLKNRTPNWSEMCKVKSLFWGDDETVIQFHPKESHYVNVHPHCLHLWKHRKKEHELPPLIYV